MAILWKRVRLTTSAKQSPLISRCGRSLSSLVALLPQEELAEDITQRRSGTDVNPSVKERATVSESCTDVGGM